MRVLIDTTFTLRGPSGTAVYVQRLVSALRDQGVDVREAANERRRPPGRGRAGSVANLVEDLRWTRMELPRRARQAGADLIHHPLPGHAPRCPLPQVVTVHDLAFERMPELFDPAFRAWARRAHAHAAQDAAAVVCVSAATAADVRTYWGLDPQRIVVARHGPGQEPQVAGDARRDSHFLYVGDEEPRKNLAVLLAAYGEYRERAQEPLPLVLAGRARAGGPGVEREPSPALERLEELYAGAAALVHPSLHEGFGLTALEAMAAGVPVIAGRVPGIAETCGSAARWVDPHSSSELAGALLDVGADRKLREELSGRGRERAAGFSWERSARSHIDAYTLAME